ncbi:MAG: YihY/virulence factor BrkB family protein [Proteobacteria bacterium]|nr:YihY/virulence factor BrkB family protein [Pseudomonadota bacterium]
MLIPWREIIDSLPAPVQFPVQFGIRVVIRFAGNQGMLLASALAYHVLLAIIPFALLVLIGLSHLMPVDQLNVYLREVMSGFGDAAASFVVEQTQAAYKNREALGITSIIGLIIFFVSAFRSIRNALNRMFLGLAGFNEPGLWLRILLPYLYALVLGSGIVVITLFTGVLDATVPAQWIVFGYTLPLATIGEVTLRIMSILVEVLLFSLVYKVVPHVYIKWKHAFIGGLAATLLWELVRRAVVWFSSTLSVANVLYGSFAAMITMLIALEAAAVILLLGAQTIAVYNDSDVSGKHP